MDTTSAFCAGLFNLLGLCMRLLQDSDGAPMADKLFGVKLHTKLKCEETGEEFQVGSKGS